MKLFLDCFFLFLHAAQLIFTLKVLIIYHLMHKILLISVIILCVHCHFWKIYWLLIFLMVHQTVNFNKCEIESVMYEKTLLLNM